MVNLVFIPANSLRIGVSASTKQVGNSVHRHRAVRLMREAIRPFLPRLRHHYHLILNACPEIMNTHLLFTTLEVEKALKQAGIMV